MKQPSNSNEDLIEDFNTDWSYLLPDNTDKEIKDWLLIILQSKDAEREKAVEEALAEYKQFILNVLDGIDIADGKCNTKAIRFALESRTIKNNQQ